MPNVAVGRDELFKRINNTYGANNNVPSPTADKAFDEVCFSYGIELDDVTSEKKMAEKETGKADDSASDEIIYKIDVPANRYDLLCVEGLARALRIFNGEKPPVYTLAPSAHPQRLIVSKEHPPHLRPVVVCAVLRNIKFDARNYKSFIDLQDKLHQNIGRRRTLVSIGTHDLDSIKGPFTYKAIPPKDIKFAPLKSDKVVDGEELFKNIEANDLHLKKFLPIIKDSPVYPVIYDSQGHVLSLPPIINGNLSKITLDTKNVFIEITATDLTKAEITLNMMVTMFSEYCAVPFSIEPVEIVGLDGKVTTYPSVTPFHLDVKVDYITSGIGATIAPEKIADILTRMSLEAKLSSDKKSLNITVPIVRSDILHACDVMEDVAIAYGYNNLVKQAPKTITSGKQQPLNKLTDLLRGEVAMAGYNEVLTLSLCSREENFTMLQKPDNGSAISIANPQTLEFQVARTTLLVGILKTIKENRKAQIPIKVFEISDVVIKSDEKDVGAINKRNLCAVYCGKTSGFEIVHGLLDGVMVSLGAKWKLSGEKFAPGQKYYALEPAKDSTFFPGRCADILLNEKKIGVIGTLHPLVLKAYGVDFPCAAVEFCIEPFV